MSRQFTVAVAQMGPVARAESRREVVDRLVAMLHTADRAGAKLVVYPELALTTFFPRWLIDDPEELESFFESGMPTNETEPLFTAARELGIGFHLGYAERAVDEDGGVRHFNTAVLVDRAGAIVGKYRKVHIPGHAEPEPGQPHQHLEKRYFLPGDLGFPVFRTMGGIMGICICNDRRWPEVYRVMGLQAVELVMLGYNTPSTNPFAKGREAPHLGMFHNLLSMQAGAYQNGTWVVAAAKAGMEEGIHHMAGSCIIAPTGEIVALAQGEGDEVITAAVDLDRGNYMRETMFNFAAHRRIEHYGLITSRTGAEPPPL